MRNIGVNEKYTVPVCPLCAPATARRACKVSVEFEMKEDIYREREGERAIVREELIPCGFWAQRVDVQEDGEAE